MSKDKAVKTILAKELGKLELFHISFARDLDGEWMPVLPAGSPEKAKAPGPDGWQYPEPPMAAIHVAASIEGCFRAVYPNVFQYFEKKNYPHMDFQVYVPVLKGTERVVTPEVLARDEWCWDAIATQEYRILDMVEMKRIGEVRVNNTNKSPTLKIHPFDNSKYPVESAGPEDIAWRWVKRFK